MTDNLRARIAAALREVDDMRVCKLSDADIKFLADAVIREFKSALSSEYHKGYVDGFDEGSSKDGKRKMTDIYVRVGPDDEWHWLGKVAGDIRIEREYTELGGRPLIASESFYVELKP